MGVANRPRSLAGVLVSPVVSRHFIEQDVGLTSAQQFLGKFAMLVFLPLVVGQHADDRGATEADQTHLQVCHVHS
jgi:predicted Na+-dependent transporter